MSPPIRAFHKIYRKYKNRLVYSLFIILRPDFNILTDILFNLISAASVFELLDSVQDTTSMMKPNKNQKI